MKKFLLICLIISSFFSCTKSLENDAKKRVNDAIQETYYDVESIKDIKVMLSEDSLVIIHAMVDGKNEEGANISYPVEYVYGILSSGVYERVAAYADAIKAAENARDVMISFSKNRNPKDEEDIYRTFLVQGTKAVLSVCGTNVSENHITTKEKKYPKRVSEE